MTAPRDEPIDLATALRRSAAHDEDVVEPALRRELLESAAADQAARTALFATSDEPTTFALNALRALDAAHTARMRDVVSSHGWPGFALVGRDAARAAWLLVQHADGDVAFQKRCLALLDAAVRAHDAELEHAAYLYDRVAVAEQRPQRFGTQFWTGEPSRERRRQSTTCSCAGSAQPSLGHAATIGRSRRSCTRSDRVPAGGLPRSRR